MLQAIEVGVISSMTMFKTIQFDNPSQNLIPYDPTDSRSVLTYAMSWRLMTKSGIMYSLTTINAKVRMNSYIHSCMKI